MLVAHGFDLYSISYEYDVCVWATFEPTILPFFCGVLSVVDDGTLSLLHIIKVNVSE